MELDCSSVKTGKFKLDSQKSGTTIITRTSTEQIEVNKDLNVKVRYKVKWIDDCTYQLFQAKIHQGNKYFEGNKGDTLPIRIIEINQDYYKVNSTSNFSDLSVEAQLEIM